MSQERHWGGYIVNVLGFSEISSYYDPLEGVIKNFESNSTFSSTIILFASIYSKKGFPTE
jgi:hypothetical protein